MGEREREREAGDSLLYLGGGLGAHKRWDSRKKSLRLCLDPRSARPPCPVLVYGALRVFAGLVCALWATDWANRMRGVVCAHGRVWNTRA